MLPYIENVKKDLSLPKDQKALLIWDAFTGQNTVVKKRLFDVGILTVNVPKHLTHLLQPPDLTTNATFKNIERREFSNYFTSTILNELTKDPTRELTIRQRGRRRGRKILRCDRKWVPFMRFSFSAYGEKLARRSYVEMAAV